MSFNQPVCNFSQNTVKVSKIKWTQQEDELLTSVVSKFGASRWDFIATHIPGRNGRQCRERYISVLTPSVCKDAWTAAEDETLLRLQKQIGNHWSLISKSLPGRTAIMAKNRFKLLCRHELAQSYAAKSRNNSPISSTNVESSSSEYSDASSPSVIEPSNYNFFKQVLPVLEKSEQLIDHENKTFGSQILSSNAFDFSFPIEEGIFDSFDNVEFVCF
ncbi:Myb-like DNA-binding domain containing protein [Trichomonas vaginalis G3]|uniref:Myb-like DNA-binding domain containing protein n=1 Tax=Trichomonas vaginalis (strain ATCC PRA-98 / G3) TaxID=412133 RepID=A2F738_TRIV3|nr:RNA polymerase II transcription regulator recruiting protein [Trichomonas vaginalis G3]EAX99275.1 Myb-like DNA-binding domain containing protein [Trichomonas vaginalis G3]KAI5524941.1 RNA polymerase II transcription regulator recruiting protein [Trichomonas vaginalis G3]|eukprot:XP_001312205.1 Myb-like DNA-binding domain containing protein [Trichomonas vaginalis G3]